MSINLSQNRGSILDLYNAVIDPKSSTNWALFGYEGHSNVLKVLDSGDDGLDELGPNFNSGRVEYALCSIPDPHTKLSKLILINWGIHYVINARCEDDVESDTILAQLKKISTAGPAAISHSSAVEEPKPVTSVYQKVKPTVEINTAARDKFWEQTEKDEHTRLELEAEKRKQEAAKAEAERQRLQESITTKLQQTQPPRAVPPKPVSRPLPVPEISPKQSDVNDNEESDVDRERRLRSDQARLNRIEEAKSLIGQRSNPRAAWEQQPNGNHSAPPPPLPKDSPMPANSAARRWPPVAQPVEQHTDDQNRKSNGSWKNEDVQSNDNDYSIAESSPPPPVPRNEPAPIVEKQKGSNKLPPMLPQHQHTPAAPARPPPPQNISPSVPEDPSPAVSTAAPSNGPSLKNLLANTVPKRDDSDSETEEHQDWDETPLEEAHDVGKLSLHGTGEDVSHDSNDASLGQRVKATWDYQAGDDTEISFEPGDIISHVEQIDPGWWQGMAPNGKFGLFPANYVEML